MDQFKQRHVLIGWYTEGSPHDCGGRIDAKPFIDKAKIIFDDVFVYSFREMREMFDDKYKLCMNDRRRDFIEMRRKYPRGCPGPPRYLPVGNFACTSVLCNHLIEKGMVKEGDIVLYHNVDTRKSSYFLTDMDRWPSKVNELFSKLDKENDNRKVRNEQAYEQIITFRHGNPYAERVFRQHCRYDLIKKHLSHDYLAKPLLRLCCFAYKVNPITREMIKEWNDFSMEDDKTFPHSPDNNEQGIVRDFIVHTADQTVLQLMIYKWELEKRYYIYNRFVIPDRKLIGVKV